MTKTALITKSGKSQLHSRSEIIPQPQGEFPDEPPDREGGGGELGGGGLLGGGGEAGGGGVTGGGVPLLEYRYAHSDDPGR